MLDTPENRKAVEAVLADRQASSEAAGAEIVEPNTWTAWTKDANGLQFRFRTLAESPDKEHWLPVEFEIRNVGNKELYVLDPSKIGGAETTVRYDRAALFQGKQLVMNVFPLLPDSQPHQYVLIQPGKSILAKSKVECQLPKGRTELRLHVPAGWAGKGYVESVSWKEEDFQRIDAKAWRSAPGQSIGGVWVTEPTATGFSMTPPPVSPEEIRMQKLKALVRKELPDALTRVLPENWELKSHAVGTNQPFHYEDGKGYILRLRRKGYKDGDWDNLVGGLINVGIMEVGYPAVKDDAYADSPIPPAVEVDLWHGRRVFLSGGGGNDWPNWLDDIKAVLKETNDAEKDPEKVPKAATPAKLGEVPDMGEDRVVSDPRAISPALRAQRNKALAKAEKDIRNGLPKLAETFPQLGKPDDVKRYLGDGSDIPSQQVYISFSREPGNKLGNYGPPPASENEEFSVLVAIRPSGSSGMTIETVPRYRNLRLDGKVHARSGDPELDKALKQLVANALAPLKKMDEQTTSARVAPTTPTALPTKWGPLMVLGFPGLQMGLSVRAPKIPAGSDVLVDIAIRNTSEKSVELPQHRFNNYDYYPRTEFTVTDDKGKRTLLAKPVGDIEDMDQPRLRAIAPAEVYIHTVRLNRWPVADHTDTRNPLTLPGVYTIECIYSHPPRSAYGWSLTAAPVKVTVMESKADKEGEAKTPATSKNEVAPDSPWGKPVHSVQVRLRTEKAVWNSNEVPVVKVDLRNNGKEELHLQAPRVAYTYTHCYAHIDGVTYRGACSLIRAAPSETVTGIRCNLSGSMEKGGGFQRFPFGTNANEGRLDLKPGKHTVRVSFRMGPRGAPAGTPPVEVFSNPVQIEIVSVVTQPAKNTEDRSKALTGDAAKAMDELLGALAHLAPDR
jgi:hypothetical protein